MMHLLRNILLLSPLLKSRYIYRRYQTNSKYPREITCWYTYFITTILRPSIPCSYQISNWTFCYCVSSYSIRPLFETTTLHLLQAIELPTSLLLLWFIFQLCCSDSEMLVIQCGVAAMRCSDAILEVQQSRLKRSKVKLCISTHIKSCCNSLLNC